MKTYSPKPDHIQRRWYVLDASEQVLGRIATEAAHILRGKHKPIYAPHADVGDHVIIVNASKVVLTGGKEQKKVAYRHSGHPGGITATPYEDLLRRRPAFAVEKAVRGMLPKNRLGRAMIKKLHVETGPEHPHRAQQPESWAMGRRPVWDGLPAPAVGAETPPRPAQQEAKPTKSARGRRTTTSKTSPAKGPGARASTAAKTSARKTTAAKTTSRKTTARKTTSAKTTSKKTTARKPAATKKKET